MTELVRGDEQHLVQRVAPLLRENNVTLDLNGIDRIDAAGIAALISLYSSARNHGNTFSVINVSPRVEEMLSLVRLEDVLVSHNAVLGVAMRAAISNGLPRKSAQAVSLNRFPPPFFFPVPPNSRLRTSTCFSYTKDCSCDVGHRQTCAAGRYSLIANRASPRCASNVWIVRTRSAKNLSHSR